MKQYEITMRSVITKTYIIEAEDEGNAIEVAHESFSVLPDDMPERYEQEIMVMTELHPA
jgi:hypothetical protein